MDHVQIKYWMPVPPVLVWPHQGSHRVYLQGKQEEHSCRAADAVHTTTQSKEKSTSIKEW